MLNLAKFCCQKPKTANKIDFFWGGRGGEDFLTEK